MNYIFCKKCNGLAATAKRLAKFRCDGVFKGGPKQENFLRRLNAFAHGLPKGSNDKKQILQAIAKLAPPPEHHVRTSCSTAKQSLHCQTRPASSAASPADFLCFLQTSQFWEGCNDEKAPVQ